jgi:galactokinase
VSSKEGRKPMKEFRSLFGRKPTTHAHAPGRVNLIGEHTDYNGGYVLPTPIPQRTHVALAPRSDDLVRVASARMSREILEFQLGKEQPGRGWLDYVQGVVQLLRRDGHAVRGFEAWIESDVPLGSGLSSSAALDVALLRALWSAFVLRLDAVQIALLGQRAENEFVGARVGIMYPMAASLGEWGSALFIDAHSLRYERVPLPPGADLVVINSGVAHDHAAGDYNTRRAECERACERLGVGQLRDLTAADLPRVAALPEPLNRRASHVLTENARVLETVAALRAGDWPEVGRLFYASHASMRDDYQVSIREIDLLVELARQDSAVYGARLTGGGFGGSVVVMARAGHGRTVAERIAREYAARSPRTPAVLVPAPPGE